jgi:hypothetical protein
MGDWAMAMAKSGLPRPPVAVDCALFDRVFLTCGVSDGTFVSRETIVGGLFHVPVSRVDTGDLQETGPVSRQFLRELPMESILWKQDKA